MKKALCILAILLLFPACSEKHPDEPIQSPIVELEKKCKPGLEFPLIQAAWNNDLAELKKLLAEDFNLNTRDNIGCTLLHVAAQGANTEVVRFLVAKGADVNARDDEGNTPLHRAQMLGRNIKCLNDRGIAEISKLFLDKGADINAKNNLGLTSLHLAVQMPHNAWLVEFYISKGANVNAVADNGYTPRDFALECGNEDSEKILIKHDGQYGNPMRVKILKAARNGDISVIKELFARGVNVNACDLLGNTSLHLASQYGHYDMVQLLLENGYEVDALNSYKETPLYLAFNKKIAQLLVTKGANLDARSELGGSTVIENAVSRGKKDIVEFLIAQGADIGLKGTRATNLLHTASGSNQVEIAELLIDVGVDVSEQDSSGNTPLDVAWSDEMKKLLRRHGAVSGKELKRKKGE